MITSKEARTLMQDEIKCRNCDGGGILGEPCKCKGIIINCSDCQGDGTALKQCSSCSGKGVIIEDGIMMIISELCDFWKIKQYLKYPQNHKFYYRHLTKALLLLLALAEVLGIKDTDSKFRIAKQNETELFIGMIKNCTDMLLLSDPSIPYNICYIKSFCEWNNIDIESHIKRYKNETIQ